jgi:hypothetical protein
VLQVLFLAQVYQQLVRWAVATVLLHRMVQLVVRVVQVVAVVAVQELVAHQLQIKVEQAAIVQRQVRLLVAVVQAPQVVRLSCQTLVVLVAQV